MATITGKTEFARRVQALGMTIKEMAEQTGYTVAALHNVSAGLKPLSKRLDNILTRIENERKIKMDDQSIKSLGKLLAVLEKFFDDKKIKGPSLMLDKVLQVNPLSYFAMYPLRHPDVIADKALQRQIGAIIDDVKSENVTSQKLNLDQENVFTLAYYQAKSELYKRESGR